MQVKHLTMQRRLGSTTLGICASIAFFLAVFLNTPASECTAAEKTDAESGKVIFNLKMDSLKGQKIHFEYPDKWKIKDDTLFYINPTSRSVYATLETDLQNYQLDAEVTVDPVAERKAGMRTVWQRRVGFCFRKSDKKEAVFLMLDRCIRTAAIEHWAAIGIFSGPDRYDRFGGKDSLSCIPVDDILGKHHLRAVVKDNLANFYINGQLHTIMDITGLKGREVGLYVMNYAAIHSFTIRELAPSTKLFTERPKKTDIWTTPFPGKKTAKQAIAEAGAYLDRAIEKKSPGIKGSEEMAHYTFCWSTNHDTKKTPNRVVAFPAFHHALIMNALMKYHDYTKDQKYLDAAYQLADWEIANSTPADSAVPNMPYSTVVGGKMGGFRDRDAIMLDKVGMMGLAYISLYERSKNKKYLEGAKKIGETLLKKQLPEGRWQNRISIKDGAVRQDYTSNQIFDIMLMDKLYEATGDKRFEKSSKKAFAWLLAGPVKNYNWTGYYEDVGTKEVSIGNWDAILTARYLVAHRDENPEYLPLAKQISDWIFTTFAVKYDNKWPLICEQSICSAPMNCHTLNYANLLADLYDATGDEAYHQAAGSVARAGFDLSRPKENRGWYSLITSPLYFGIDLVDRL